MVIKQQKEQEIGGRLQRLQREKVGVLRPSAFTEDLSQHVTRSSLGVFIIVKVPAYLIPWELSYQHVALVCGCSADTECPSRTPLSPVSSA